MRWRLAGLILLFMGALSASSQTPLYGRLEFQLQNAQGQALSGAIINVYTQSQCGQPSGALATLYPSANAGAPLTQPLHTNGFGEAHAYAAVPACYTVVYSSPSTGTVTRPDQFLGQSGPFDGGAIHNPLIGTSGTFSGTMFSGAVAAAGAVLTNGEYSNGTCADAATIDIGHGNRQSITLTGGHTCVLTFTQPSAQTASVRLTIHQAASGGLGDFVGGYWPNGVKPTATQIASATDAVVCDLDGSIAKCSAALNFSQPLTSTPAYLPIGGAYQNDQTVTISDAQSAAAISYCTDTPGSCSPGTAYSSPLAVGATGTHLRATALAPGYGTSGVQDQTYTFSVATPTASPAAGYYTSTQSVTLSTATTGAAISYCLDTTETCTPSTSYSGAVSVTSGNALTAVGTKSNYTSSSVIKGLYTNKGHTSGCTQFLTGPVTSIPCASSISVTAGDYLYIVVQTILAGCPAGNTTDVTGMGAGATVTVLAHCTGFGITPSEKYFSAYQVVIGTTGTITPAVTTPSAQFPVITADGFSGLTTGIVGSVLVTQNSPSATTTATGPTLTPTIINQIILGYWTNQSNQTTVTIACSGGASCALTRVGTNGWSSYYSSPVLALTPVTATLTTSGNQTYYGMLGMVIQ